VGHGEGLDFLARIFIERAPRRAACRSNPQALADTNIKPKKSAKKRLILRLGTFNS
jgi:hypothetical protein